MKKTIITLAIILCINLCSFAQGGLFGYGVVSDEEYYGASDRTSGTTPLLNLPNNHGMDNDVQAPLGGGALLLIGFGAAYALKRQQNKK